MIGGRTVEAVAAEHGVDTAVRELASGLPISPDAGLIVHEEYLAGSPALREKEDTVWVVLTAKAID